MEVAIETLRAHILAGMSLKKALTIVSKKTSFKRHQLRYQYQLSGNHPTKPHGNCKLTSDEDQILKLLGVAFSCANQAWDRSLLAYAIQTLFGWTPNRKWLARWIEANNDWLRERKTKHLSKKRNTDGMASEVEDFIISFGEHIDRSWVTAANLVNYDETRVCVKTDGTILLERSGKDRGNAHGTRPRVLGSLLTFVSAQGDVLSSFWIMKADVDESGTAKVKVIVDSERYPPRKSWNRYYGFTTTGYINNDMFRECFNSFMDEWALQHPGKRVFTVGDQLNNHIQIDLCKDALGRGVEMWLLPSNTSHFLQPLDHVFFATFKSMLFKEAYPTIVRSVFGGQDLDETLFLMALDIERKAFQPQIIRSAFRETGLWPWNPDKIRKLTMENSGIAALSPEEVIEKRAIDSCSTLIKKLADEGEALGKRARTYTTSVPLNGLHSPAKRLKWAEDAAAKAQEDAEEKAKKRKAREDAEKEKAQRRASSKCCEDSCQKIRRCGKAWAHCENCSVLLCPDHKKNFAAHVCTAVSTSVPSPVVSATV